jgi:hypothetical protein
MLLSFLLYGGVAAAGVGAISSRRRFGAALLLSGIASAVTALLWPARERCTKSLRTRLDDFIPCWHFVERHEIRILATPSRIYEAILQVTPAEIAFFQTLTAVRRLGCRGDESILNAPDDEPILSVATRTGFRVLAGEPPRELVFGMDVAPQTFAVMNFLVHDDGLVTTETRVAARTDAARRKFAVYWRLIRPGSGIIRRSWLLAIKRRAEATA